MNETVQDPEAIERDIRRTQEEMSRTVDKIGDQFTARNILNGLLDKADEGEIDVRGLLDGARRNPIALAMIAGGAIWPLSDSDAKVSSLPKPSFGSKGASGAGHADPYHRDYVSHMEQVEWRDDEDPVSYQRRRDIARANYFMIERGHDEDDTSFRQRLDGAAEKFRERRHAWSDQAHRAGEALGSKGRDAASRAQDMYASNPLVGGLVAAAVGALFGSTLPMSRTEEEQLSGVGEKARRMASEQKDKVAEGARQKKDQLVAAADENMQAEGNGAEPEQQSISESPPAGVPL